MRTSLIACVLVLLPWPAFTHPAPFSYLDLRLTASGVDGTLILHDFDVAHDVGVERPETLRDAAVAGKFREQLNRLMASRFVLWLDNEPAALTWTGFETLPERQSLQLTFRAADRRPAAMRVRAEIFPYDPVHQTFINIYENGDLRHQAILGSGRTSADYYSGSWQGRMAVFAIFVPAGIEHIVIGPDHVLFLIGLLLLGGSLRRLAVIVTAFTIGHSITLSLAALDVLSPPASVIEPAIALSIIFIGADNLLVQKDVDGLASAESTPDAEPSQLPQTPPAKPPQAPARRQPRDIRPLVAAVFGLVHGFGFAAVLKEFALPLTALGWSLLSFNVGVEIGQLAIVLLVAWALAALRQRSKRLSRQVALAGSVIVMAAGGYWFVERVFLSGRL
jgi:hydrogenase/urease accessory protein HupE